MSARLLTVILGGTMIFGATLLPAAPKHPAAKKHGKAPSAESHDVAVILQRESIQPLNRQAELKSVLIREPDSSAAHWHSGDVSTGESWCRYDAAKEPATGELLQNYREARYPLVADDYKSHQRLAQWCRKHGLPDQEYAHLTAAFQLAPPAEQEAIANRLGYQRVGGQWLNLEELADLADSAKQTEAGLKLWRSKLEQIARQLDGGPRQRQTAQEALLEIRDPAAIPAIELMLATRNQNDAVLAIRTIGRIEAYQASLALARHAVFSPWPAVRNTATELLRSRRFEDFVPPMLELLATPVSARERLIPGRKRGELFYTQILARETANQVEVNALEVPHDVTLIPILRITVWGKGPAPQGVEFKGPEQELYAAAEPRQLALREADDRLHRRELLVGRQNDLTAQLNGRLITVLTAVSGQKPDPSPEFWWDWWNRHSDIERLRPKDLVVVKETSSTVPTPIVTNEIQERYEIRIGSCFKAGTPVWTETGMMPIERLQVGDRVLSQNAETGELAYKPVLYKSLRPAKQLLRVAASGEQLVCTGGHRFWVAGEAWTKARELTPEHLLHTATGTIRVDTVSPADTDETHNLVVADFHSYFVGKQAILVQDLPLPRSTNCVVPGLQPEW